MALTACASSAARRDSGPAPDPIVRVDRQVVLRCPSLVDQAAPSRPVVPDDAELTGSPAALAYVGARFAWGDGLAQLWAELRAKCASIEGG